MIRSKATAALMRLKEIDKKYKVRYDDKEKNDRSSENTESLIDDHRPKNNDYLVSSIPVEQKILKSTLSIKIPDACSEHVESRSSTSDNNISIRVTTAVEKTSEIVSLKEKTEHSDESEKSRSIHESEISRTTIDSENPKFITDKSENTRDIEQLNSINEYIKTRSVTEIQKSRSITEIDEILDDDESVVEILDRSDMSNSKSFVKSGNELILVNTKDLSVKSEQSKDSSLSQSSIKSKGYSDDSFESVVSEKESSRRSQSHKSLSQSLRSQFDAGNKEKSLSSSNEKSSEKINENSFRQISKIDTDEGISNFAVASISQEDKLQVEKRVLETPIISSDNKEEASTYLNSVTKESDMLIKKLEPSEISYESSHKEELSSEKFSDTINKELHSERKSSTPTNSVWPITREESSNSSESLDAVRSIPDPIPRKIKMFSDSNKVEDNKNCLKSVIKETTKLYRNRKDCIDLSHNKRHLKKCRKEHSESSSISQSELEVNTANARRKNNRREEFHWKSKTNFRREKSNFEMETKRNKLASEKDSTGEQRPFRSQPEQDIKTSRSAEIHPHSRKTKFPGYHNRELQSLEKRMNNLRMEQEREKMLFYIRNFDEDKRRLLMWPSQLNSSGKPEIPILKPLDFPNVANFTEPDSTAGKSSLGVDIDGELLKNRIVEIRRWLKDQFILYRDYCDVAAAINAKYAEEQKSTKGICTESTRYRFPRQSLSSSSGPITKRFSMG